MGACVLMVVLALLLIATAGTHLARPRIGVVAAASLVREPAPSPATTPSTAKAAVKPARVKVAQRGWKAAATSTTQPPGPAVPAIKGALPVGKGMWIYNFDRSDGGNVPGIIHRAQLAGLTHLYIRTGSTKDGFYAQGVLNRILPAAHAAGIRVYGWDFPYLNDYRVDVGRAMQAITYRTPNGQGLDGFTADIETRREGVNINVATGTAYGTLLRQLAGNDYPLIATVPRPNPHLKDYPFAEVAQHFDAVAPMVYWLNRDPVHDVLEAMPILKTLGKPIMPVGQAYDGAPEGGKPGVPPPAELNGFMRASADTGASAVSFWSWQAADQPAWDTIQTAPWFTLPVSGTPFTANQIRGYQTLLSSLGFFVPNTGMWDDATVAAMSAYQKAARLPVTGGVDPATRRFMLQPFAPPIRPLI
ncbi:MAG: peptidoglycan-binding protein [Actinobacteria bacterium]|nr:peptidoglycan-binding protein [Actinomycetota bacterium]MBV8960254.1 peptidoglycan-binding protein [Actinomycetota bacterium]MBV9254728.1 peptidoglycan-binding protein [Actinomycetota bacterium]MBV9662983.1 peptidoglycan-binding protein [Actinomycetota bacterium]MBV9933041.1 peptidoglycan-binding protein [Actinomycetota bacterium]